MCYHSVYILVCERANFSSLSNSEIFHVRSFTLTQSLHPGRIYAGYPSIVSAQSMSDYQ